jgi:DNA repair protein RadD
MKQAFQIRYYQEEAVLSIYEYFQKQTGNPIVAMPTGTGKSIVIGEFVRSVMTFFPGQRIMKLTHVKELIEQNYLKLIQIWPTAPAGIYSAGLNRREIRPITFAGIGSVAKKPDVFGHVDILMIDEAHLVSSKEETNYQSFINGLKNINPKIKVVGFTATPYRLGQGMLTNEGGLFTDICYDLTGREAFNRLIAEGFISPLIPRRTKTEIDISDVHLVGGEFNQNELQEAVDRQDVTTLAIDEMIELGEDRKHWLVFATGITHAEHVAGMLCERGIPSAVVHSKLPGEQRDNVIRMFKRGELRAVVNNNVLTTGFDFPGIDLIGMLRPTTSPGLWVQMLGRGTRPCEGKNNCLVLDFAGNTCRLGPINDPVIPRQRGKNGGGIAPVKLCEACGTYNHASVRFCCSCGAEFPKEIKLAPQASNMELIAGKEPQIEVFAVDSIDYHKHKPRDSKPISLKVSYHCGMRQFSEWVCFEHEGFALHKAHDWWKIRTNWEEEGGLIPQTVDEALDQIENIGVPTHIRVWVNNKHPRIMATDFTDTAFGAQKPGLPREKVEEDVPF